MSKRKVVYRVPHDNPTLTQWEIKKDHTNCGRYTGHLGSGLYVYLKKPTLFTEEAIIVEYPWPWKNPFIIRTEDEFFAFDEIARHLCRCVNRLGESFDPDIIKTNFKEIRTSFPERTTPNKFSEVCEEAIRHCKKRGVIIQPINYLLAQYTFDGVVNKVFDTNQAGSVVYDPPAELPQPDYDYKEQLNL